MLKSVLAIDPGISKCGMALVQRDGDDSKLSVLWREVTPRGNVLERIRAAEEKGGFAMVIVGSGTTSKDLVQEIRSEMPSVGILVVDEKDTTMQARERYWEHNKRKGWRKLLPASLQMPPDPVDDFVAVILAERVLLA